MKDLAFRTSFIYDVIRHKMESGKKQSMTTPPPVVPKHAPYSDVPNEFRCPISLEIMTNPVICQDGMTYEKASITKWFRTKTTSPLTREELPIIVNGKTPIMLPNRSLKEAIDKYVANEERLVREAMGGGEMKSSIPEIADLTTRIS